MPFVTSNSLSGNVTKVNNLDIHGAFSDHTAKHEDHNKEVIASRRHRHVSASAKEKRPDCAGRMR